MKTGAMVFLTLGLALVGGCGTHTPIGGVPDGGLGGIGGPIGGGGGAGGVGGPIGGSGGSGGNGGVGGPIGNGGAGGHIDMTMACGPGMAGRSGHPGRALSFLAPVDYDTGAGALAAALGDLNGDGKLDLALLDATAGVRVLANNGDGTLAFPTDHPAKPSPTGLALGDLTGDGKIDMAVVSLAGVSVLVNQGGASFAAPVTYIAGAGSTALAVGDLNGDGRIDIAVANASLGDFNGSPGKADVAVFLNTGGGSFAAANYPAGTRPTSIAVGDLNGDCRPDLVVGDATNGGLTVLLNNGAGVFKVATSYGAGTYPLSIAIGDLNGDGKADLAAGSFYDEVYVLLNYGDGTFTAAVSYSVLDAPDAPPPIQGGSGSVVIGDLTGDGIGDLVVASPCCGLSVFVNHGDGTLATPMVFPGLAYARSVALGDLNGDGQGDLAVVVNNGGAFVPFSNLNVRLNAP